jgi:ferritin-like metal-binding protein YciE
LWDNPPKENLPGHLGLVEGGEEVMEDFEDSPELGAGVLSGAQAVEHYEISHYGTLIAWAGQLGMKEAELLTQTLEEEKKTDAALSKLAQSAVNKKAA